MSVEASLDRVQRAIGRAGGVDHLSEDTREILFTELGNKLKKISATYNDILHINNNHDKEIEQLNKILETDDDENGILQEKIDSLNWKKTANEEALTRLGDLAGRVRPVYNQLAPPKSTCSKIATVKNAILTGGAIAIAAVAWAAKVYLLSATIPATTP